MPAVETLQDHTLAETDSVEENCVLVGLKGSYLASADAALKRINEIRKEACKQGVQDPRDPNRKLTMSDYVPVKWSSDLEYIARVRAAEASVYMDDQMERCVFHRHHQMEWRAGEKFWHGITAMI